MTMTPDMICGSFNPPDTKLFYNGKLITDDECQGIALEEFAKMRMILVSTGIVWLGINFATPPIIKKFKKMREIKKK